jgi:hypothetical protein
MEDGKMEERMIRRGSGKEKRLDEGFGLEHLEEPSPGGIKKPAGVGLGGLQEVG